MDDDHGPIRYQEGPVGQVVKECEETGGHFSRPEKYHWNNEAMVHCSEGSYAPEEDPSRVRFSMESLSYHFNQ